MLLYSQCHCLWCQKVNLLHQETVEHVLQFLDRTSMWTSSSTGGKTSTWPPPTRMQTPSSGTWGPASSPPRGCSTTLDQKRQTAFPLGWIEGDMDRPMYKNIMARKVIPTQERANGNESSWGSKKGQAATHPKSIQDYFSRWLASKGLWSVPEPPTNQKK